MPIKWLARILVSQPPPEGAAAGTGVGKATFGHSRWTKPPWTCGGRSKAAAASARNACGRQSARQRQAFLAKP